MTMTDLALGDPSRIKAVAEVAPDAADSGVVRVSSRARTDDGHRGASHRIAR
jgi:hypothetical protein